MSASSELDQQQPELPLLPLRDVVVFPHMVIPLFVGRPKSIKALETAMEAGKSILLVAQKSAAKDEPSAEDLYEIGCMANILQMLKLPDGKIKVIVEGVQRARIDSVEDLRTLFMAKSTLVPVDEGDHNETEAMRRAIIAQFDQYVKLNKKIPPEILTSLSGIDDAGRLADTIAAHLPLKLEEKQAVLELFDTGARLERLLTQLETELDILQVEKRIRGRVKRQMEKSQREYYLNEQVKAIQKVFGDLAYKLNVSSTKSMTGHLLGAAGAVEAIACILAIQHGYIPPTINHFTDDPEIDPRLNLTFNEAQERKVRVALSNTFGFGGHNASVLFKQFEK